MSDRSPLALMLTSCRGCGPSHPLLPVATQPPVCRRRDNSIQESLSSPLPQRCRHGQPHSSPALCTSSFFSLYRFCSLLLSSPSLFLLAKNCYCFYIQLMLYNIFLLASSDKCLLLLFMIVYFCSSFVVIEVLIK